MKVLKELAIEKSNNGLAHAYLFIEGSDEDNKKLIDFFIKNISCLKEDLSIISPDEAIGKAGEIKIEDIRDLIHTINLTPNGKSRIAVINSCEKLNRSSGNILLKSLEEPPSYLTFLLFSGFDSILPTIKSRCRVFYLNSDKDVNSSFEDDIQKLWGNGFSEATKKIDEIIKEKEINTFLNDLERGLRYKMNDTKDKMYAKAIEDLESTRVAINANANPKLSLECLFLKLEPII